MPDSTPKMPSYPAVEAVIDMIADWVTRYREATGSQEELRRCRPEEVKRIAHDLGVSPDELCELAGHGPQSAALLSKMLSALGIDLKTAALSGALVQHDLQRLCVVCRNKGRCQHELDAGTAANNYRKFCPNAVTLDALVKANEP